MNISGLGSEVVISGISLKLPGCNSLQELKEVLFSEKVGPRLDFERWNPDQNEKPYKTGLISERDRFDWTFFGVHSKLAKRVDPIFSQILERSYEAIMDAGVCPSSLSGKNVCVVSSVYASDSENLRHSERANDVDGSGIIGLSRAMVANRLSYFLDVCGPSFGIDANWQSAVQGLEQAAFLISEGACESAVVATSNVIIHNALDHEYSSLNLLSYDTTRPFDAKSDGFIRSEGTIAFFLEKASCAKRNYCSVIGVETCYFGSRLCSYTKINEELEQFFKNFYSKRKVKATDLAYIEAFATCTQERDAQELNAIYKVFCEKRSSPLPVGSVKGNIGHTDCVAPFAGLAKCIVAMETGMIPPTMNYDTPNPEVPSISSGELKINTENLSLQGDIVGVNSLSFNGYVGHIAAKQNSKTKRALALGELPVDGLPRLLILRGRDEDSAKKILNKVNSMAVDVEYVSLVNDAFKTPMRSYLWNAFTLLPADEHAPLNLKAVDSGNRPLWFVFSGMGSQWPTMGKELLALPVFSSAVDLCDEVLKPKGVDIRHILTSDDPAVFDNIINCFVGIAAIQIGLVDIMRAIGVQPDGFIGHSVGELGCAYLDGCLTAEQVILGAYARGKASLEGKIIPGMMAAIGLSYSNVKDRIPATIDVACHNSTESSTLSGPTEDIMQYVEVLKKEGVFAKAVNVASIPYHSRYINPAVPKLYSYLQEIIPEPRTRSRKWISSSVPEAQWGSEDAQLCSAEYLTNNLRNPVLFEEACRHIPEDAILLEIAPHGLLQAILRRFSGSTKLTLSLTSRAASSNINHLLKTIGQLYLNNVEIDVNALYPPIQYPVARGTPGLADLVTWDHSDIMFKSVVKYSQTDLFQKLIVAKRAELSTSNEHGWTPNEPEEGLAQAGHAPFTPRRVKRKRALLSQPSYLLVQNNLAKDKSLEVNDEVPEYELWKDFQVNSNTVVPFAQILMNVWTLYLNFKRTSHDHQVAVFEDVTVKNNITADKFQKSVLITLSPATLSFEATLNYENSLCCTNIMEGKLNDESFTKLKCSLSDFSTEPVIGERDIYKLFDQFGLSYGPQFRSVKQIRKGYSECLAKVVWSGNMIVFIEGLMQVITFLKMDKSKRMLLPIYFEKLAIEITLLNQNEPGALLDIHYDYRTNCLTGEGVQFKGLVLGPSKSLKGETRSLSWKEMVMQPYHDSNLKFEDFISVSAQIVLETNLLNWSRKTSSLTVVVVCGDDKKSHKTLEMLKDRLIKNSDILIRLKETTITKLVEEPCIDDSRQNTLIIGEYHTLLPFIMNNHTHKGFYLTFLEREIEKTKGNGYPGLKSIFTHVCPEGKIGLLKKVDQINDVKFCEIDDSDWVSKVNKVMSNECLEDTLVLVFRGPAPAEVLPILAEEHFSPRTRTVFIMDKDAPKFDPASPFYAAQLCKGLAVNILREGVWGSLRTLSVQLKRNNELSFINETKYEDIVLDYIGLNRINIIDEADADMDEVRYVDYSGRRTGKKIMGIAQSNPKQLYSNLPDTVLRWEVPECWSMEDAVTVPLTYSLVYYSLCLRAQLEKKESVLIHAGNSPVGIAAIRVALNIGACIFTTVPNQRERSSLMGLFPSLLPSHVIALDKENFYLRIKQLTGGRGVDVILNLLTGDGFHTSTLLMAPYSRFVHLGPINQVDKDRIGMKIFIWSGSLYGVSLKNITNCREDFKEKLQKLVLNGIHEGVVKPLKRSVFSTKFQEEAHMHLQTKSGEEKTVMMLQKTSGKDKTARDDPCVSDAISVIVAGSNPELSLDIAEWQMQRGQRKLLLIAEKCFTSSSHARRFMKLLHQQNASVTIASLSRIQTEKDTIGFLKKMGTISSIICIDMNKEIIENLDSASRVLAPKLKHFVTLFGDGSDVCSARKDKGLAAVSIQNHYSMKNTSGILPYLSTILLEEKPSSRLLYVSETSSNSTHTYAHSCEGLFPSSLEQLVNLSASFSDSPVFSERVSLSPGLCHVSHSLLPVILVPSLGSASLDPLVRQLIHPAFVGSLPPKVDSIEDLAESLFKELSAVQSRGPYSVVGASWLGVPVALALGRRLEAAGHEVGLVLLEGGPSAAADAAHALREKHATAHLATALLAEVVGIGQELLQEFKDSSWDECLKLSLQKVPIDLHYDVSRALTSFYSQLVACNQLQHSQELFKGKVTLISRTELTPRDVSDFAKWCLQKPKVVISQTSSHEDLIASNQTAAVVNESIAFTWDL